jgi:phosphotransferase family enzyme
MVMSGRPEEGTLSSVGDRRHAQARMPEFGRPLVDARLPELAHAFEDASLRERFGAIWNRERGRVEVTGCARADTKYLPGVSCVVAYDLTGVHGGDTCSTIGVVSVQRTGSEYRLFLDDPALTGLRAAMDARYVRSRLHSSGRAAGTSWGSDVAAWPVRYKPGVSCVIRYSGTPDAGGELFAKLFASRGAHHASVLEALAALTEVDESLPRVPSPVTYWPDLRALAERPMEGNSLGSTVLAAATSTASCERILRHAGRAMAAFHQRVPRPTSRRTLLGDLAATSRYGRVVAALAPEIDNRFRTCLAAARDVAGRLPADPQVASHGAIRLDQFMVDVDGSIGLVDFDGFCAADPGRDVANLLAYLDWRSIRCPGDATRLAAAERAWTEGYAETAGRVPPERCLAAYRAASMLKIAGRSLRSLRGGDWPHLPTLLDRAAWWLSSA